eukprot:2290904-Alexandrium_andersonii.AAC.1
MMLWLQKQCKSARRREEEIVDSAALSTLQELVYGKAAAISAEFCLLLTGAAVAGAEWERLWPYA